MRGSRVVRLMNTRPWVKNAAAMAHRARRRSVMACIVADSRACPTPAAPELWLVRHGETEWSRDGRHTSTTDLPLTPVGEAAATALAPRLADVEFDLVLTSPRQRARRTAELAGRPEAEADEDLVEWAYGDYEGITTAEVRETVPGWTVWTHPSPGGETADEVAARLDRVVARAREASDSARWSSPTATRCACSPPAGSTSPPTRAASSVSTPRPCRSWASSGRPRCC